MSEGVFACELEGDRLFVSYANPAFGSMLGLGTGRPAAGEAFFDLLADQLDAGTRSELETAIESGRQVWVRLDDPRDPGQQLRLMVKPASVPGAWVGSIRVEHTEPSLSIRSAVLAEHSDAAESAEDDADETMARDDEASSDTSSAARIATDTEDTSVDPADELREALAELIPELSDEAWLDEPGDDEEELPGEERAEESPAEESPAEESPAEEPIRRIAGFESEPTTVSPVLSADEPSAEPAARPRVESEPPAPESAPPAPESAPPAPERAAAASPSDPTIVSPVLESRKGEREASLARALDAAGITWLEQDLGTGALTLAGRRLHDPEAGASGRSQGLDRLIYPGDQERRRVAFEALTAGRADELYCAYRVRDAAGAWQWMLETGHVVDESGKQAKYVGTLQSVPDRESLEIPEDESSFAPDAARALAETFHLPGALAELHYSTAGRVQFTFLAGRLEGLDLLELQRRPESLLACIDAQDREELESRCAAAARELGGWDCAFGYDAGDGERRWAYLNVEPAPFEGEGALFRGFVREDSERRRVEQALAESEKRFRQLYEAAPFMMHTIDASGAIVSVNARWLAKLGYERDDVVGTTADRIFAPEFVRLADVGMLAAAEGDGFLDRECLLVTRDGRELECLAAARIERDDAGELVGAHFLLIDVTDRNRAMQALKDSEARFRAVVQDQTDAICRFGPDGKIRFANDAFARATSAGEAQPLESNWFDLLDELQGSAVHADLGALTPEQPLLQRELRMRALDARLFQWTIRAFFDEAHRVTEFQGVGRDMEELQQLEAQIREVSQAEQRRIGHDLHDGLGQELTGVSLMLRKLELDAAAEAPTLGSRVASVRRMVNQSLATARSLARGLSPLDLERGGLAGALEQLATNAEEMYGVTMAVECAGDAPVRDQSVATELYRIAQEATNNAVKHGNPSHISIRLLRDGARIVLEVEDDGAGLPESAAAGAGMGLKIMRYRANIIGASIEFLSKPSKGTLVRCQLQLPAES